MTRRLGLAIASSAPFLGGARGAARGAVAVMVAQSEVVPGSERLALNLIEQGYTVSHAAEAIGVGPGACFVLFGFDGSRVAKGPAEVAVDHVVMAEGPSAEAVRAAAARCFDAQCETPLEKRLLLSLKAGISDGIEPSAGWQSAQILIQANAPYPDVDVRVDSRPAAVDGLQRIFDEQHLMDLYFAERQRNPGSTEFSDQFIARLKRERAEHAV